MAQQEDDVHLGYRRALDELRTATEAVRELTPAPAPITAGGQPHVVTAEELEAQERLRQAWLYYERAREAYNASRS